MAKNFPSVRGHFFGVDGNNDALAAESVGAGGDEVWGRKGTGVDAHFVGAGTEHGVHVLGCPDAAADGERHKAAFGGAPDDIDHGGASVRAGGDIKEDHFIGALGVVAEGEFDGIADVFEAAFFGASELDAAGDATVMDIEAGDDAFG
jgi:hypothetical protein